MSDNQKIYWIWNFNAVRLKYSIEYVVNKAKEAYTSNFLLLLRLKYVGIFAILKFREKLFGGTVPPNKT